MPKIVWEKQANRTAEEQRAAEWRVIKKYLKNRPTGTELHPSHSRRINLIDDMTGDRVYLTHRYLKGQGNNDFFVKSNGQLLGKGAFGEVTFAETEDEVKLAIKEFKELSPESRNNDVAYDLNKARKIFSDGSKYYQVYQFLGTPGDKYIKEHPGDFDLAIKAARVTHYLHTAVYSKKNNKYAHLDIKIENICIDDNKNVHLIDYDNAQQLSGVLSKATGSPQALPKEFINISKEKLDIFALKRLLWTPSGSRYPYKKNIHPRLNGQFIPRSTCNKTIFHSGFDKQFSPEFKRFLDTTKGDVNDDKAMDVVVFLILEKYGLCNSQNIKAALQNPEQFDENYQLLEKLGLNTKKNIQAILNNPQQFNQNYQSLKTLKLHQQPYVQKILNNPNIIDRIKNNKEILLVLNQLQLNQENHIQEVLNDPQQFSKNYQKLKNIGLHQQAYVNEIINNPNIINIFEKNKKSLILLNKLNLNQQNYIKKSIKNPRYIYEFHKNQKLFLILNQLGLNQDQYIQKVIDNPIQFSKKYTLLENLGLNKTIYIKKIINNPNLICKFKENNKQLLILNDLQVNQEKYINAVINNPKKFEKNYQLLEKLGLNQSQYIKLILDHPEKFEKNYQQLKNLGLHQKKYVQIMLDHPKRFEKNYQLLINLGLHQKKYFQTILDHPQEFTQNYQLLKCLNLNQENNIQNLLNNFDLFNQNYDNLDRFGMAKKEYIQKIINQPKKFDEIYRKYKTLKLDQLKDFKRFIDYPEQFEKDYIKLKKLKNVYYSISDKIQKNKLKAHGYKGGSKIMFQGKEKIVPKGISKIWKKITDEKGNFKLMDNVDLAFIKSKSQAESKKSWRFKTMTTFFLFSYRGNETKKVYADIDKYLS